MKFPKIAAVLLLSMASVPAVAQDAPAKPQITQGATVYDPQGGVVGTIESVSGSTVVVNTGTNSATLDAGVFGTSDKGLSISFTQAQLNQAIEAANQAKQDKLAAALVVGAAVRSKDNLPVGVIKTINPDGSVLVEGGAGPYTLTRKNFATDANGLIIRMTAQQLNKAIAKATGQAATTAIANASTDAAAATAPAATAEAAASTDSAAAETGEAAAATDAAATAAGAAPEARASEAADAETKTAE